MKIIKKLLSVWSICWQQAVIHVRNKSAQIDLDSLEIQIMTRNPIWKDFEVMEKFQTFYENYDRKIELVETHNLLQLIQRERPGLKMDISG